jgi:hypothetical protein
MPKLFFGRKRTNGGTGASHLVTVPVCFPMHNVTCTDGLQLALHHKLLVRALELQSYW